MSQVINTNIMSLNAQRNLQSSSASLSSTIQRLSSGLRINSAKDDAAGLAISERFSTQIRGMDQAARNANDGISMAQTAEGALSEIGNNLQRIRELSVQARNATNSESDRKALNAEVQLLKAEIQRVAEQTNFNGTKLLDGTFQAQAFQIGADQGETIAIAQIANANIADLGYYNKADTAATMNAVAAQASGGAATVAAAALTAQTIGGTANPGTFDFTPTSAQSAGSLDFEVAGVAIQVAASPGRDQGGMATAIKNAFDAAKAAPGGTALADITVSVSGSVVTFSNAGAAAVSSTGGITGTAAAQTVTGGTTSYGNLAAGDLTIGGVAIGAITNTQATAADGVDALVAAITAAKTATNGLANITATNDNGVLRLTSTNGTAIQIGGTAPAKAGLTAGTVNVSNPTFEASTFKLTGEKGSVDIVVAEAGSAAQRASNLVTAVNNQSYNTGVTASLKDGKVVLSSAEGNFTVAAVPTGTQTAAEAEAALLTRTGLAASTTANFVEGAAAVGFADLDISTELGADNAILAMDAALNQINSSRAELGAIQNRFTSVVSSLNVNSENLSAARSRIRDTDFAKETAELTRTQILQQAGTAMLAQANQSSQNVLSLLR